MKKSLIILLCIAAPTLGLAQKADVTVSPLTLAMVYQDIEQKWNKIDKGVSLELILKAKTGGITNAPMTAFMAEPKAGITITDSTGASLGTVTESMTMNQNEDNPSQLILAFKTKKLPAAKTTALTIKGKLPVILLSEKTKSTPQTFDLKKDTAFTIGGLSFKVKNAGASQLDLNITADADAPPFELIFTDKDGKEAELSQTMSSRSTMGKLNANFSYQLEQKYDQLNITVSTWKKAEKTDIPVDLTIDMSGKAK